MTNPVAVAAEHDEAAYLADPEGAGVVSSWYDVVSADDPVELAFASSGAALDSLGFVADPFGSFLSSAIAYLIEHISFLHEPLDALAGDPAQITAQARTWAAVSGRLRTLGQEYRAQAAGTTAWAGAAADAYRATAQTYADALADTADGSRELASLVLGTGAMVGTERAVIRDAIADALASWLERFLLALVVAPETMGGSAAVAAGWIVWEAIALAYRIADRVSELLDALADVGGAAARIAGGIRSSATALGDAARYAHVAAQPVDQAVGSVPVGEAVELGKQFAGAETNPLT